MPCIEVVVATAADAFLANPEDKSIVQPTLDILKTTKGLTKVYYGQEAENPKQVYVYIVWETLQDHHNFEADKETFPLLAKSLTQVLATPPEVVHIDVVADPYKALEAPSTELAYVIPKAGVSKETLQNKLSELVKGVNGLPESHGAISAVWGPTVEKEDTFGLIIGWASVDAHWKTVKTVPEAIQILKEMGEIATMMSPTHQFLQGEN